MESNNIITAPEVDGVQAVYKVWSRYFLGTIEKFYEFMTTPSPERQEFMNFCGVRTLFKGAVAETVLRHEDEGAGN